MHVFRCDPCCTKKARKQEGHGQTSGGQLVNPTTRSLLFWMVPVVVVVLIWNLSSQFQTGDTSISFSEFIRWVETGQVDRVELIGNGIVGTSTNGERFRTYAAQVPFASNVGANTQYATASRPRSVAIQFQVRY